MFMRCKLKTKYGFEPRPGFKYEGCRDIAQAQIADDWTRAH